MAAVSNSESRIRRVGIPCIKEDGNLQSWLTWLRTQTPEFRISGDKIKICSTPDEFFHTLKDMIKNAKFRITLASLYLGTGTHEKELVDAIQTSMESQKGNLRVRVLLDETRGSRGDINSRTMLLPLLKLAPPPSLNADLQNQDKLRNYDINVALFHTPNLRGIYKYLLSDRWNEVVGVTHMKLYIVDNSLIISGANLSKDYFVNRQDRYYLVQDSEVTDFFDELVATVSSFSFQLLPNNTVELAKDWPYHPYKGSRLQYVAEAKKKIENLFVKWKQRPILSRDKDTFVYPLIQMAPFEIQHDFKAFLNFLALATSKESYLRMATGYFNFTKPILDTVLNSSQHRESLDILIPHPSANGFFNGTGVSKWIPSAYTYFANLFWNKVVHNGLESKVKLWEYENPGWTFHAKGLWYSSSRNHLPSLTIIGSPNFGYRWSSRDLEAQIVVVTQNSKLQEMLHNEQERLFSLSTEVTDETFKKCERKVPFLVRLVAVMIKNFF